MSKTIREISTEFMIINEYSVRVNKMKIQADLMIGEIVIICLGADRDFWGGSISLMIKELHKKKCALCLISLRGCLFGRELKLFTTSRSIQVDRLKRIGNVAGAKETVEQDDWRDDTDDESEDQELEAQYTYMAQIQEVTADGADNSGPIFDTEPMQKIDQNDDDDDLANECELASLIKKLKCEIDDSKKHNKFLETSNKKFQAKLDKRNDVKYASKMEIDCAKAKGDLISYKMESPKSFDKYTQTINDLNQTISKIKKELCAHQETISILSQAKEAQIKLYKTREDKELDKVIALENKVKALDNIVYKTGQSVQTMNMLNSKCKISFTKPEFLKKAQRANPRMYDIGFYNDNLVLMLAPESDEVIRLEKESRLKLSDLIRPFDYEKLNNLYDLFVPQREKSSE
nr:hypothetical protein [Tanacetum cinerariifolium]